MGSMPGMVAWCSGQAVMPTPGSAGNGAARPPRPEGRGGRAAPPVKWIAIIRSASYVSGRDAQGISAAGAARDGGGYRPVPPVRGVVRAGGECRAAGAERDDVGDG